MGSVAASAPIRRVGTPSWSRHRDAAICAAWVLVLTLVLFAPLATGGTVLLLDQSDVPVGPHATLGAYAFGFPPGLTSRVPITGALLWLFRVLPFGPVKLLPVVAYVPIAAMGMYRLVDRRALPAVAATTLFVVNPFTYDRAFAGQVYILLGYALLPLAAWLATREPSWRSGAAFGLVISIQAALSIHFVFITGLVAVVALLLGRASLRQRAAMFGAAGSVCLVASAYWLIPIASQGGALDRVTLRDVAVFQTEADPALGLLPNVIALRGFWRGSSALQPSLLVCVACAVALLAIAAFGARAAGSKGSDGARRRIVLTIGVLGLLLACGAAGPFGDVFVWAFEHVPGFRVMREPQKFLALYALGLSWCFGLGVERLVRGTQAGSVRRPALAVVLCAVPLAAAYPLVWGFWGQVRPSTYPASWTAADQIMGPGPDRILGLPGDAYVSFPWTQGRAVANPMTSFFSRDVVCGGSVELAGLEPQTSDATSRYVSFVTSVGRDTRDFGNLVAPLDVRFVVLAKTEDWARYRWLFRQRDLAVVGRWPDLVLFENRIPTTAAYQPGASINVNDWGEVIGLASSTRLTDVAVGVRDPSPGPIRVQRTVTTESPALVAHVVDPGREEMTIRTESNRPLVVARTFDERWSSSSGPVSSNLGVDLLVPAPGADVTLSYDGWRLARTSYAISIIGMSVLLVGWCVHAWVHRRSRMALAPSELRLELKTFDRTPS
jgi:hypothetical protein